MSAVVSVFAVWFAIVIVLGVTAVVIAPRVSEPAWLRRLGSRFGAAEDGSTAAIGRFGTGIVVWLAAWSLVLIIGWALGNLAHRLQDGVDWPVFRWLRRNHLDAAGDWSKAWHKLTNVGSPAVCQYVTIGAAVLLLLVYAGRRLMWLPSATMVLAYLATFCAQILLKDVVHRGHPPGDTLGTWPSGGVGRVTCLYSLVIFFVILRFWRGNRRMWAAGGFLALILVTVQAYARLYNLEHWVTDVIGGFLFGLTLLVMMVAGYWAIAQRPERVRQEMRQDTSARSNSASAASQGR